jgi:putative SbcD/Mre11-related phosphoesterase
MVAVPIYGARALTLELEDERVLLAADLHLGLEGELAGKGIELPSQIPKVRERLLRLIRQEEPDRLIFLGDVKHNVPITSWQEWRDLPDFFSELSEHVRVEILPGNHDGDIEGLVPRSVVVHDPRGTVVGTKWKIGLMHGHTWPALRLLKTNMIIMGHNHPVVEFRDEAGARVTEPAWLRYWLEPSKLPKNLQRAIDGGGPQVLVMPAFSELISGAAVNRAMPEELLGPIFKARAAKLDEAEVYLLDGTFLGTLGNLKKARGTEH